MTEPPPSPRSLRPLNLALWFTGVLAACAAIGCLAAMAQQHYAPLVLFPLFIGLACGAAAAWLARKLHVGHRVLVLAGTALGVFAAVGGLHRYSYHLAEARSIENAQHLAQLAAIHPEFAQKATAERARTFLEFLEEEAEKGRALPFGVTLQGAGVWGMWWIEGLLVLAAAMAVVVPTMRSPYCDRCRTWYRAVRKGTLTKRTAGVVAGWCQLPAADLVLDYRLLDCASGCGPTGLELSWPVTPGERAVVPAGGLQIWLSEEQRKVLMPLLDEDTRRVPPVVAARATESHGSNERSEPPAS